MRFGIQQFAQNLLNCSKAKRKTLPHSGSNCQKTFGNFHHNCMLLNWHASLTSWPNKMDPTNTEGLVKHWIPLKRPYQTLISKRVVTLGVGPWLTRHEIYMSE